MLPKNLAFVGNQPDYGNNLFAEYLESKCVRSSSYHGTTRCSQTAATTSSPLRSRPLRFFDRFKGHRNEMHVGSISPLCQKMKHVGSASPLHQVMHDGSLSPPRQRKLDHRYGSDFEHAGDPHHGPGYKVRKGPGRSRERDFGSFNGLEREPSPPKEEPIGRNNPNVSPREGDWICIEPSYGNLNFACQAYCNNCNRLRFTSRGNGHGVSPRRHIFWSAITACTSAVLQWAFLCSTNAASFVDSTTTIFVVCQSMTQLPTSNTQ